MTDIDHMGRSADFLALLDDLDAPLPDEQVAVVADQQAVGYRRPSLVRPEHFGLSSTIHHPVGIGGQSLHDRDWHKLTTRGKSANRDLIAVGSLLRDAAVHLLMNPDHVRVHERPHVLTWYRVLKDGRIFKKEFVPEFAVLHRDGTITVVHVLTIADYVSHWWRRDLPLIKECYELDHRVRFHCMSEAEVRVEPLLSNLKMMRRHLPPPADPEALLAIRSAIGFDGLPNNVFGVVDVALRRFMTASDDERTDYERCFSAIFELAYRGEIKLDLSRPFDPTTTIRPGLRSVDPIEEIGR